MNKTPNYRQDKKRREDAQKKRNAQEQERQAARKKGVPTDPPLSETAWGRRSRIEQRDFQSSHRRNARLGREGRDRAPPVPVCGNPVPARPGSL